MNKFSSIPVPADAPGKQVLALIPARGGSKGIPGKNIQPLGGLPLIAYSIRIARQARNIQRVLVSTDSPDIARVAREAGAEAPFLRPAELAGDSSQLKDVIDHALAFLRRTEDYRPDVLAILLPTHPFRSPELVEFLVERNLEGYNPVQTVRSFAVSALSHFVADPDGLARPCLAPSAFCHTGETRSMARNYGVYTGQIPGAAERPYIHVLDDLCSCVDIDTPRDLRAAELLLERGSYRLPGEAA